VRALVYDGSSLELRAGHPEPTATGMLAVAQVRLAGVCATDLEILHGYMAFDGVPGHEMVGQVIAGPSDWIGARVVAEINFGCGRCETCTGGLQRHCPSRRVMGILGADGAFAERVCVPVTSLHRVPAGVTDQQAVFCEPLAAAFEILEQVEINTGADCVVLGDGRLGLLCAQVLATTGAQVSLVGKHPDNLALVEDRVQTVLLEAYEPAPADVVVEATGSASGMELAMRAVRPRGTVVLKSTVAGSHTVSLAPIVINEVTVVGSRCGPFAPALAALEAGTVDVERMISATFPLDQGIAALDRAARPGVLKVLLRP
jgi:threonine dehydrogenase-like Zn-dependent dehydrogenase